MRFRPPLWAVLLTLVGIAVAMRLGFWQLDRAHEKMAIFEAHEKALDGQPEDFDPAVPAPRADAVRRVALSGRFLEGPQLLLDNQIRDGRPGVRVWSLFLVDGEPDGIALWVDRGWIGVSVDRSIQPEVPLEHAPRALSGVWRSLPEAGYRVPNEICEGGALRRVQYPRLQELQCLHDGLMADGLLLMDDSLPDGFLREWRPDTLSPRTHVGYAVQWFAIALAILVLFTALNLKRRVPK